MVERSITTDCKSVALRATQVQILLGAHKNNEPKAKALGDLFLCAEQDLKKALHEVW
jgi:hypothetical protein